MPNDVNWVVGPQLGPLVRRICDVASSPAEGIDQTTPDAALTAMVHSAVALLKAADVSVAVFAAKMMETAVSFDQFIRAKNVEPLLHVEQAAEKRRVVLTAADGRIYHATVVLESANGRALGLEVDGVGAIALVQGEDGAFRDVMTQRPVVVVPHEAS